MNELVTVQNQNQGLITYNKEQVQLIKDMYAKRATDSELQLLMYMSNRYGLDILTKQIWCVKFGEAAAQIYAGRDGFLEVGHRNGNFNGMDTKITKVDEPFSISYSAWENKVKVNKTFKSDYQFIATCTVYRKDMEHPITVEVYEEEYSTGQGLWQSKRRTMIAKVAESQALRKAFSISGLYAEEETYQKGEVLEQNEIEEIIDIQNTGYEVIGNDKISTIKEVADRKGITEKSICKSYKIDSFKQMTVSQWVDAISKLDTKEDRKAEVI